MKSRPLSATTVFCSFSSSFAFSRFRSRSGFLASITRPAMNIGTKRIPISSHPCQNRSDPAGTKIKTPRRIAPMENLVSACVNKLFFIVF